MAPEHGPNSNAIAPSLFLVRMANLLSEARAAHFRAQGLSVGRFEVLLLLHQTSRVALSPSAIAERAGVTRGTVTGLLDGLERDRLIERRSHPEDRRMLDVRLTKRGEFLIGDTLPGYYAWLEKLTGMLSMSERTDLIILLTKVGRSLDTSP